MYVVCNVREYPPSTALFFSIVPIASPITFITSRKLSFSTAQDAHKTPPSLTFYPTYIQMASSQAPVKLVNESAVEFLTTEMVEAMIRTIKDDALRLGTDKDPSLGNSNDGAGGPKDYSEGDEAMEAVYYKLEMIGFRVGERLIEKYDSPSFIVQGTINAAPQKDLNRLTDWPISLTFIESARTG